MSNPHCMAWHCIALMNSTEALTLAVMGTPQECYHIRSISILDRF